MHTYIPFTKTKMRLRANSPLFPLLLVFLCIEGLHSLYSGSAIVMLDLTLKDEQVKGPVCRM